MGPAVLPDQWQMEWSDVPRRGTDVDRLVLGVALLATRREFALPEHANRFTSSRTILPGAGRQACWCGSSNDYWKGQKMKGFHTHVGFDDFQHTPQ